MAIRKVLTEGLQVVVIYAAIAALYIVFSDHLLALFIDTPAAFTRLQTVKGLGFVAVTALLLYGLIVRMNRRLHHYDEQYQNLFESNPVPMYIYRVHDLKIVQVNAAAIANYGFSRPEFLRLTIKDLHPPEDVPALLDRLSRAHPESQKMSGLGICRHRRADGSLFWVDIHSHRTNFEGHPAELVVAHDVSQSVEAQEVLQLNAEVLENSEEGIMVTDADNRIMMVNRAFERITGYQRAEVLGKNPSLLNSGLQDDSFYAKMWDTLKKRGHWRGQVWNRRKDGSLYPEQLSISTIKNDGGVIHQFIGIFSDKSQEHEAQEQIDFLSNFDALTQLPNRIRLREDLQQQITQSTIGGGTIGVLALDLDRFKHINDGLGYEIGNQLLIDIAQRLNQVTDHSHCVYRHSGDEFIILLANPSIARITSVAETILQEVCRPIEANGNTISFTTSIGIAMYPRDGQEPDTLLQNAETALAQAKASGRNNFHFFDESSQASSLAYLRTEHGLRQALNNNELLLHYQPLFDARDKHICGFEALIRWQHPESGLVPPDEFIPVAEESGQIVAIGRWVLHQAVSQAADWHRRFALPGPLAVNISAVEFHRGELVDEVRRALAESQLPAALLCLEITERIAMEDSSRTVNTIEQLHQLGVSIAIDDFGAGYSSLNYLKRLNVDILKIDKGFVEDIGNDPRDESIVKAVVELAHSLGFRTVAEGVETEAQYEVLSRIGCDEIQGYHLARPMPFTECEAMLSAASTANSPSH